MAKKPKNGTTIEVPPKDAQTAAEHDQPATTAVHDIPLVDPALMAAHHSISLQVGISVQFFTASLNRQHAGQGAGPYAARITRIIDKAAGIVMLAVKPPAAAEYDVYGVHHGASKPDHEESFWVYIDEA